jgi:hypothetical protein
MGEFMALGYQFVANRPMGCCPPVAGDLLFVFETVGCLGIRHPMKLSPCFLLFALAIGLALTPAASLADYQLPENALERLEKCVKLSPAQEQQALQIFQNLKDIMDDMDPADRPTKGMQCLKDARAAIRAILTPEQQAIYDQTPQRLGGGSTTDPGMRALRLKISKFVREAAEDSPEIAAEVGTIQRVALGMNGSSMVYSGDDSQYDDPALHPDSGTNIVRVTGSLGAKAFKIYWKMDNAGTMTVSKIEDKDS